MSQTSTDAETTSMTDDPTTTLPDTMTAVRQRRYGRAADVLSIETVPVPTPSHDEVLVRVDAASVNPADWHRTVGEPMVLRLTDGLRAPSRPIPGSDAAGTIVAVGDGVVSRSIGDTVVISRGGAFAEYVCVPAERAVLRPEHLPADEAAGLGVAGVTAWQAVMEHGAVRPGQTVVVNGASGGVGHYAVQLAVEAGARVIGICSGPNADLVAELGADEVVDYTTTRPADVVAGADLVIDLAGLDAADAASMLADHGTWLILGMPKDGRIAGPMIWVAKAMFRFIRRPQTCKMFVAEETPERLRQLVERAADGRLRTVVERRLPLTDVVAAYGRIETGRTVGKIVLVP